jgi:SAM-dependent methyltransferase
MSGPAWSSYDEIAEDYDAISAPRYFERPAERLVALLGISRGDRFLDAGAGTGVATACALRLTPHVVALDLSLRMLRRARARGAVPAAAARLPELPFADRSFDRVAAAFVLNHLPDPGEALLDLGRVLSRGGRLGLASWARSPSDNEAGRLWNETARGFIAGEILEEQVGKALPSEGLLAEPARLRDLLSKAGLSVDAVSRIEFPISIPAKDYLASRSLAMTARFMKDALPAERWRLFEQSVERQILTRFGRQLELTVLVNFAVATRPPQDGEASGQGSRAIPP